MKKKYGFTAKAGTKKAFTLAEVLITLVVLGVAIALTVPSIIQKKPNENMVKFKKAYATAEKVISELANDETLYPDDGNDPVTAAGGDNRCANSNSTSTTCHKPALMNTINRSVDGTTYGATLANSNSVEARSKFCNLFAAKVNTVGTIRCGGAPNATASTAFANAAENNTPSFETADGITWYINTNDAAGGRFGTGVTSETARGGAVEIQVDINQSQRSTNTFNDLNPDRFRIWISPDGKMTIPLYAADTNTLTAGAENKTIAVQYLRQTSPSYRCRTIANGSCNN